MKHLKRFNENVDKPTDEFEYRHDVISKNHKDNKSKLKEGDNIIFFFSKWNYKTNKNDVSEETGKIIELIDSSKEIVDFDVKVLPDSDKLKSMTNDKDGYIWISSHDIKYQNK